MRALVVRKLGNPVPSSTEKVPYQVVEDHPTQQVLPANAVRIKVAAAGLNFADALQVQVSSDHACLPPHCQSRLGTRVNAAMLSVLAC